MAIRRNRTVTITVTKRNLMAVTTVTRRIPTVKITMVINNPMEDTVKSNLMVIKATVMVMDTNLNTVTTTTNNLTAILLTVIPTDIKAMEVTVMAMVINNTEAMVIDKPTEDTVTNLPTDTDTKVMEAMVT